MGNGQSQNQDSSQNGEQSQEQNVGQGNNQSEQQEKESQDEQNQEQENGQGNGQDNDNQNSNVGQEQGDDHSFWEEVFREHQEGQGKKQGPNAKKQAQNQTETQEQLEEQSAMDFDERGEFEDNRKEKIEKFKSRREKIEKNITRTKEGAIKLGSIGESKEAIDWKVLIRRDIEKSETIWSQRRSIAENNYAYRLEENDIEDDAETEIMIDISGSVELDLVKAFLRQIKPLLKQSKLRVGCFNELFWGMVDIKNERDIDNFTIPEEARDEYAWTEDWDLAVRSFTKKREINKIVFTDGEPCPGTMPREDLKRENVIWIVYGNKEFEPCCGKVIHITEKQLERLNQVDTRSYFDERSR